MQERDIIFTVKNQESESFMRKCLQNWVDVGWTIDRVEKYSWGDVQVFFSKDDDKVTGYNKYLDGYFDLSKPAKLQVPVITPLSNKLLYNLKDSASEMKEQFDALESSSDEATLAIDSYSDLYNKVIGDYLKGVVRNSQ